MQQQQEQQQQQPPSSLSSSYVASDPYGPPTVPLPLQMALMSHRPPIIPSYTQTDNHANTNPNANTLISPPVPSTSIPFTFAGAGGAGSAAAAAAGRAGDAAGVQDPVGETGGRDAVRAPPGAGQSNGGKTGVGEVMSGSTAVASTAASASAPLQPPPSRGPALAFSNTIPPDPLPGSGGAFTTYPTTAFNFSNNYGLDFITGPTGNNSFTAPLLPLADFNFDASLWQSLWDPFFINDATSGLPVQQDRTAADLDPELVKEIDEESGKWWSYCEFLYPICAV